MSYDSFKKRWIDKRNDYDGGYGYQCVDLIKQYLADEFGIRAGAWGNAIAYWNNTNPGLYGRFNRVANTPDLVPPTGSIAIFNPVSGNPYGHIAIVDSASKKVLNVLEQNGGRGSKTGTGTDAIRVRNIGYGNVAGFLIPKNNNASVSSGNGDGIVDRKEVERIIRSMVRGYNNTRIPEEDYSDKAALAKLLKENEDWTVGVMMNGGNFEAIVDGDAKSPGFIKNIARSERAARKRADDELASTRKTLAKALSDGKISAEQIKVLNEKLAKAQADIAANSGAVASGLDKETTDAIKETHSIVKKIWDKITSIFK